MGVGEEEEGEGNAREEKINKGETEESESGVASLSLGGVYRGGRGVMNWQVSHVAGLIADQRGACAARRGGARDGYCGGGRGIWKLARGLCANRSPVGGLVAQAKRHGGGLASDVRSDCSYTRIMGVRHCVPPEFFFILSFLLKNTVVHPLIYTSSIVC